MKEHRIRMIDVPGESIPSLFVEMEENTWLELDITLSEESDLHSDLHLFWEETKEGKTLPMTWATRAFDLFEGMGNYVEGIIPFKEGE